MHDDEAVKDGDDGSKPSDMLLVLPRLDQAGHAAAGTFPVLRRRGETVELGAIRELETGKPIHGDVVKLERRSEHPMLFNVETVAALPSTAASRSGPPQVASEEYRAHWEAIFGADAVDDDHDDHEDQGDHDDHDDQDALN